MAGIPGGIAVRRHIHLRETIMKRKTGKGRFLAAVLLIFPVDEGYYSGGTLGELNLTWYSHIDPEKTVEIANYFREKAAEGETVFYDIYTEKEKADDPEKRDTGLFFFRGNPGERFAVCNAGGGFAYVGAMRTNFRWTPRIIPCGAAAPGEGWRPGSARMERRPLGKRIFPARRR